MKYLGKVTNDKDVVNKEYVDNHQGNEHYMRNIGRSNAQSHIDMIQSQTIKYAYISSISPTQATAIGIPVNAWYNIMYIPNGDANIIGYSSQIVTALTSQTPYMFVRSGTSTNWGEWKEVYTSARHDPTAMPKTGGVFDGRVALPYNSALRFRHRTTTQPTYDYDCGIGCDTKGFECLCFMNKYIGSEFRFHSGIDLDTFTVGTMYEIVPHFKINKTNAYVNGNPVYHAGNKPTASDVGASPVGHTHPYSPTTHTHDDRYYTESEVNTKLATKSDTEHSHSNYSLTSHTHSNYETTMSEHYSMLNDIIDECTRLNNIVSNNYYTIHTTVSGWEYKKYGDGTLEACIDYTTNNTVDITTTVGNGGTFVSPVQTFSFAELPLTAIKFAKLELIEDSYSAWISTATLTKASMTFQLISNRSRESKTRRYVVEVKGRWK